MKSPYDIILKPIITEASMSMSQDKRYCFKVARTATKPEIAEAIEKIFKVDVACVNTINCKRKPKRLGARPEGSTSAWKKAIVTLKPDSNSIEFFDGMI